MFIYDSLHAKLSDSGSLAGLGEVCQIPPIFSQGLYVVVVRGISRIYLNADALRSTCGLPSLINLGKNTVRNKAHIPSCDAVTAEPGRSAR